MEEILAHVQQKLEDRMDRYIEEWLVLKQKDYEDRGKEWTGRESMKKLTDKIRAPMSKEQQQANIHRQMTLIRHYPETLEPPKRNENRFVIFMTADKKYYDLSFSGETITCETKLLKGKESSEVVKAHGLKVIQTPYSNRIF